MIKVSIEEPNTDKQSLLEQIYEIDENAKKQIKDGHAR